MHQLSGHDAGVLWSDTTHANANVSLLHIYDQSTAPDGKVRFKSILAHIAGRLDRAPMFRQKLLRVPLDLDRPYWVEDDQFDLEYHVRHIALPKPGDWRQFCIQASRIHARPLDLNRPLWEIYVIEGLDSFLDLPEGSFALLVKTHLAAVGVAHVGELTPLLHDTSATPPAPPPPAPWFAEPPPSRMAVTLRGALRTLRSPSRWSRPVAHVMPSVLGLVRGHLLADAANVTRFNSVVSPHRVFDTRRFLVSEFDEIRALVPGATLDDAVLAVCGGALRLYLDAQVELPEHSLVANAPRALPAGSAIHLRDRTWLRVALGTDLADPVQRLASIQAQTSAPPVPKGRRGRAPVPPLAHCTLTPLPGPAGPQYLCGARMTYQSTILPIADGMGLVFALTVYDGRVVLSPTSCRELMPDPEVFAQALRDSFQELLALARAAATTSASQAPRSRAPRPARTATAAPKRAPRPRPPSDKPPRPARPD
ncbi:wax ester/triacylglycerol synthase domain-containing protein [Ideonella sp. A 288]|uniref:wax ester/triacylglycerol synthase domain-containing protein n=1 Tax=Ideonella sp. A 288 TaxID=1962181 RepID=UPI000B4BD878|nr:wax ester/triacylglycerol synthase domain-containing protein [Ideonella sp. A 288]